MINDLYIQEVIIHRTVGSVLTLLGLFVNSSLSDGRQLSAIMGLAVAGRLGWWPMLLDGDHWPWLASEPAATLNWLIMCWGGQRWGYVWWIGGCQWSLIGLLIIAIVVNHIEYWCIISDDTSPYITNYFWQTCGQFIKPDLREIGRISSTPIRNRSWGI